ncbi:MAG: hypothetical protein J0H34_06215 [Rhizobiales bacterium]|nr:hypothetical protein [Hyphomicrobiales bacterium]
MADLDDFRDGKDRGMKACTVRVFNPASSRAIMVACAPFKVLEGRKAA